LRFFLRFVIASPGIRSGKCVKASGNGAASGHLAIAARASRAALFSAVRNPFPLNCDSAKMMLAPTAPRGNAANWSCVNLATAASTCSMETKPFDLRFFFLCLAASSGANGAKATKMANAAAICFRSFRFIFL
jgi:hypothetical protein